MKQLLLNVLIIFGSAYAYIQLAGLFPISNTTLAQQLHRDSGNSPAVIKQSVTFAPIFQKAAVNLKNNAVEDFFERSSSLNMIGYFDIQTLFYYPSLNFTSFDLFHKYPDVLKHDKSK